MFIIELLFCNSQNMSISLQPCNINQQFKELYIYKRVMGIKTTQIKNSLQFFLKGTHNCILPVFRRANNSVECFVGVYIRTLMSLMSLTSLTWIIHEITTAIAYSTQSQRDSLNNDFDLYL